MPTPAAPHGSRCLVRSFPPSSPHRRQSTAGLPVPSQRGSQCRGPAVPRLQAPELSTTSPVLLSAGLAHVAVLRLRAGRNRGLSLAPGRIPGHDRGTGGGQASGRGGGTAPLSPPFGGSPRAYPLDMD